MNSDVLVIGEALIDIVNPLEGEVTEHVGGSPANVAIGLARLGHSTALASWFGSDCRGERIREHLIGEEVAVTPGSTGAARTPTATAHLDARGAATYEFDLDWQLDEGVTPQPGVHIHIGSFAVTLEPGGSHVQELVRAAHDRSTISYDPNARPSIMGSAEKVTDTIEAMVRLSDVVKASDEDVAWLYGESPETALRRWMEWGPRVVMITLGPDGVLVGVDDEVAHFPTTDVRVVDTVGAGDSFMSGILSGMLDAGYLGGTEARDRLASVRLADLVGIVRRAQECSNVTVSRAGANPPRREELSPQYR